MFYRSLNNIKVSTRLAILGLILITNWVKTYSFTAIHQENILLNMGLTTILTLSSYYLISLLVDKIATLSFQSFTHFFIWIGFCFVPAELFSPVFLIGNNILLIILGLIFSIHLQFDRKNLFNIGIAIGLLSLLDPTFSVLLIWVFLAQTVHRDLNLFKWLASILGFSSIWIIAYAILGFTDYHIDYQAIFTPVKVFSYRELPLLLTVFGGVIASINFFTFTVNLNLTEKEEFKILNILGFFLSIFYIFNKSISVLFTITFALMLSFWFVNLTNKRSREFLLYLSLFLGIYFMLNDIFNLPIF